MRAPSLTLALALLGCSGADFVEPPSAGGTISIGGSYSAGGFVSAAGQSPAAAGSTSAESGAAGLGGAVEPTAGTSAGGSTTATAGSSSGGFSGAGEAGSGGVALGGSAGESAGAGGVPSAGSGGSGEAGAGGAEPEPVCECSTGACCDGCHIRPRTYFCGEFVRTHECVNGYYHDDYWNLFCSGTSAGECTRWGARTKYSITPNACE